MAVPLQVLLPPEAMPLAGVQLTLPPASGLALAVTAYVLLAAKVPVTVQAAVTGPAVIVEPETLTVPQTLLLPTALAK